MCDCWKTRDDGLREKFQLKIHDACSALELDQEKLDLRGVHGLPLQRLDGRMPTRNQPKMIEIGYCPFCGQRYVEKSAAHPKPKPPGS